MFLLVPSARAPRASERDRTVCAIGFRVFCGVCAVFSIGFCYFASTAAGGTASASKKPPHGTQHRRTASPPKRLPPTPRHAAASSPSSPTQAAHFHPSPPALASSRPLRWLPLNSGGCAARIAAALRHPHALRVSCKSLNSQLSQRACSPMDDLRLIERVLVSFWGAGGGLLLAYSLSKNRSRGIGEGCFVWFFRDLVRIASKAEVYLCHYCSSIVDQAKQTLTVWPAPGRRLSI